MFSLILLLAIIDAIFVFAIFAFTALVGSYIWHKLWKKEDFRKEVEEVCDI